MDLYSEDGLTLVIAGGRDLNVDLKVIDSAIEQAGWKIKRVIFGDQEGIDRCAFNWARTRGIPYAIFPANWDIFQEIYGNRKFAGPFRNRWMAEVGEALLLIMKKEGSPGSLSMEREARKMDLPIFKITTQ